MRQQVREVNAAVATAESLDDFAGNEFRRKLSSSIDQDSHSNKWTKAISGGVDQKCPRKKALNVLRVIQGDEDDAGEGEPSAEIEDPHKNRGLGGYRRATYNFMADTLAIRLKLMVQKTIGKVKTVNSKALDIGGMAVGVSCQLGIWKGIMDFTVTPLDDFKVVIITITCVLYIIFPPCFSWHPSHFFLLLTKVNQMDAFSSSFLSTVKPSKFFLTPKISIANSFPFPHFNVSSARIEEKSQPTTTGRTTTKTQPKTTPPLSSSPSSSPVTTTRPPSSSRPLPSAAAVAKRGVEPTLPTKVFSALDDLINIFIDPPIRSSVDPRYTLSNNFAPVDELPPTECEVIEGSLPSCLDGAYIRNGPNPQYLPRGPYHLFDGDGMLHSIRITQGKATLCSRYVKTYKYTMERDAGAPLLPNVFSGFNGLAASAARGALSAARILSGQFNPANGIGLANTSLAFFGNKLYALGESDLPYAVRLTSNGDIETLGRDDFDGKLFLSMTAHPKIDFQTGETFAFRYGPVPPFLTYFRLDSNGNKQPDVPIFSMVNPSFIHDFAISKKYAIFVDIQIGMNPMEMIFGGGSPVGSNPAKVSRIGVIPRYATDETEMRWFDVPGFNVIHAINAWDEEDAVVILAPNILSVEHTLERMELVHALVEKVRIDLKTGIVTRNPISARNLDFGVINPEYVGKKNRFIYAAIGDPMPKISGVVKLDVSKGGRQECTVARRVFGPRCYGGEPFFVARQPENPEAEEDDGYVVSYVHDEIAGESKFLVMDAKSPNLDIVAAVKLPRRVPYGFHGLFVRDSDLKKL
ncbi:probable carotenoid cleavage dioxygenase 4, chloroplastic [Manihot esculenta]|nr:probable carotenoid cleavage dioxygenase 4, chloroplastic [Manihot esculenta]